MSGAWRVEVVRAVDIANQLQGLHGISPAMIVMEFIEDYLSRDG